MIDHGLLIAASVYTGVLIAAGVAIVLALGIWAVRPSLKARAATRDLRRTADTLQRSSENTPAPRTPHHVH